MRGEFIDAGGTRLYYYAAGTRGVGDPVVFVHGFPTSSRLWQGVVRDFVPGHRLVVLDLPGFGRSDPPAPAHASCGGYAATLKLLLDELRIPRAVLVGHGLGGGVAQAFAVQWPAYVSGLALVSSVAFGARPRGMARLARALGPVAGGMPPALLAGLVHRSLRRGFADPERGHPMLDSCLRSFATPGGRHALALHLALLGRCDTREWTMRVGTIAAPTAIFWGADDPFYPVALGQRLTQAIPGATIEVVPGAAHFVPEDQPDRLRRGIERLLARAAA